jgi:hypothetical protein
MLLSSTGTSPASARSDVIDFMETWIDDHDADIGRCVLKELERSGSFASEQYQYCDSSSSPWQMFSPCK